MEHILDETVPSADLKKFEQKYHEELQTGKVILESVWLQSIVTQIEAYFINQYLFTGLESSIFQTRCTSALGPFTGLQTKSTKTLGYNIREYTRLKRGVDEKKQ